MTAHTFALSITCSVALYIKGWKVYKWIVMEDWGHEIYDKMCGTAFHLTQLRNGDNIYICRYKNYFHPAGNDNKNLTCKQRDKSNSIFIRWDVNLIMIEKY